MLKAENIYKSYGKKEVLKGTCISVMPGEISALVGKNGCGKSTLLQIITGTLKADKAEISFFGKDACKDSKVFSKYAGYVPQDDPLFEELTVKDNLRFWAAGIKDPDLNVIEQFGLTELLNTKVSALSGGMKRRLTIASTLQRKPPVLVLDEPTSSLDLYYQESIREWMKDYVSRNGTVVLSTHNEKEILMADTIWLFNDGKTRKIKKEELDMDDIRREISS
ncbi:MAG: ABC transporter ATP-binding protein [Lachnospiraceae bacterium]|nr:ABC transporter ATP-binding protein [Lachnospiraceae bacterium]